MTRWVVPNNFGKYPLIHLKQRQLHADTDTFGRQSPKHTTDIYGFGNPIIIPKTDSYGKPMTDSPAVIVSVRTTTSKTNHNSPSRKTDSSKSNIYIAVGAVTFLLITAAVLLLIAWAMKRKNQRRVESAEICEA